MADRYWVGGTGAWNASSTTNWSATSGGAGGASIPTAADNVFFNQAGTYTVTISGTTRTCLDITVSAGTVTFAGTVGLNVSGSMSLIAGTVWSATSTITFNATTTGKTVTTNGVTINGNVLFSGTGGGWTLGSALTLASTRVLQISSGTLDLSTFTLTVGSFSGASGTARTLAFGTGNITVIGTSSGTPWNSGAAALTTTGSRVVNIALTAVSGSFTIDTQSATNEANSINFNVTAGTYTLSLGFSGGVRDINFTGFAGTVSSNGVRIFGNLNLGSTATFSSGAGAWTFASTSTGKTITTNGKTMPFPLTFDGVGGSWILQDALTMGAGGGGDLIHTNGTLDLNGKTLTALSNYRTAAGTKNLTFNGGTLVCLSSGATPFNNAVPTGFTTTAGTGTGTISMAGASSKTFAGGGSTFNCTLNQGGLGTLAITGANTFDNITNTVQPASVLFTAATINTFNSFNLNGTAGNLITIGSVTAASHTLSKSSGTVSCDYLSISRSTATGGASWYAGANSTNGGNNTGWIFTAPPGPSGNTGAFFSIL
jgi:hypothetical protein